MHEASIAESLIELAEKHLREGNHSAVSSVTVRIGRLSGVMPDALLFAFEALKGGTPLEGATLLIDVIPQGGMCKGCEKEFSFDGPYISECPLCGGAEFSVTRGRELEMTEMEVA
ncbi:MAG: hydrogenase maturation nickel metallochaperone HypA [Thermodesulfovibrionales bacterium]|nr:hydrogenase maturation nickel metallochaperone HypA [Thermodesulfovibrionales bacterium]